MPGAPQHQLEVEELVQRQAAAALLRLGDRDGPVHRAERVGKRGQRKAAPELVGENLPAQRHQSVEVPVDQGPDDLVAQALRRRVDREHLAPVPRRVPVALVVGLGEDDVFARSHLAAVVEAHRPGHEERLAHLDRAIEEGLSRPDALERAALVLEHRVEDAEPLAGRQHALGHHPAYAGHIRAHARLDERGHGGCVHVAVGEMPEEVLRGADAEPLQRQRPALADALEELDRGVEPEEGHRGER